MAATRLAARQGDMLDELLWRELSLDAGALDVVLAANPGLADAGLILPLGTAVMVPAAVPAAPSAPLIQLWD